MEISEKLVNTARIELALSVDDKNYLKNAIENITHFGFYSNTETVMSGNGNPPKVVFNITEETMAMALNKREIFLELFEMLQLVRTYPAESDYINGINFRDIYAARDRSLAFCETSSARDNVLNNYVSNMLGGLLGSLLVGYQNECGEDMVLFYNTIESISKHISLDDHSASEINDRFPINNRRDLFGNLQKVVDKLAADNGVPIRQEVTVLPASLIGKYIDLSTLVTINL